MWFYILDDWTDYWRLLIFGMCCYCVVVLVLRFKRDGHGYNIKTIDHWFANLMWSITGAVFVVQGAILDIGFTPGLAFASAAALVSGKALHQTGAWGKRAD